MRFAVGFFHFSNVGQPLATLALLLLKLHFLSFLSVLILCLTSDRKDTFLFFAMSCSKDIRSLLLP